MLKNSIRGFALEMQGTVAAIVLPRHNQIEQLSICLAGISSIATGFIVLYNAEGTNTNTYLSLSLSLSLNLDFHSRRTVEVVAELAAEIETSIYGVMLMWWHMDL